MWGRAPGGMALGWARLLIFALLLALPSSLAAHAFKRSYADLRVDEEGVTVVFDLDPDDFDTSLRSRFDNDGSGLVELEELQRHGPAVANTMRAGLWVERRGQRCEVELRGHRVSTASLMVRAHLYYRCAGEGPVVVLMPLLRHLRPGHVHFITVRQDGAVHSAALTRDQPRWGEPSLAHTVWTYTVAGVEHILIGYDHLLFLFALLVVAPRVRDTLGVVTAFTVAHSVTLAAAAFGWVVLPSRLVESAIALTIAGVGALNLWRRESTSLGARWGLTFGLGLVHGFGFASVLGEVGLPPGQRLGPVLSFNLGVELGQVAVALLLVPALLRLRKPRPPLWLLLAIVAVGLVAGALLYPLEPLSAWGVWLLTAVMAGLTPRMGYQRTLLMGGSAAVVVLGLAWFVTRALDL